MTISREIFINELQESISNTNSKSTEALHQDIQNLHVDMLKGFDKQTIQIQDFIKSIIVNATSRLENEIEELQRENRRLKIKCGEL